MPLLWCHRVRASIINGVEQTESDMGVRENRREKEANDSLRAGKKRVDSLLPLILVLLLVYSAQ